MKGKALLIISSSFYWHLPCASGLIPPEGVRQLLKTKPPSNGDDPYPYQYLFGSPNYMGLLRHYLEHDWELTVCSEQRFCSEPWPLLHSHDRFDFQLSGMVHPVWIGAALSMSKVVTGWCHPLLGGKHYQAHILAGNGRKYADIPRQIYLPSPNTLSGDTAERILNWLPGEFFIVKSVRSSRSRFPNGDDYHVVTRHGWHEFYSALAHRPHWFRPESGILVSELIQTQDHHIGGANAIVHKVHVASSCQRDETSYRCHIIPATLHIERRRGAEEPMGALYEHRSWRRGDLAQHRRHLENIVDTLSPVPCLMGLDLMIPSDGIPRFLEINKIAGTYLDIFAGNGKSVLENYMEECLAVEMATSMQKHFAYLEEIASIRKTFDNSEAVFL